MKKQPPQFRDIGNSPNFITSHIQGTSNGHLILLVEYATSQEEIDKALASDATLPSLQLRLTLPQARKLAEGLKLNADRIQAALRQPSKTRQ